MKHKYNTQTHELLNSLNLPRRFSFELVQKTGTSMYIVWEELGEHHWVVLQLQAQFEAYTVKNEGITTISYGLREISIQFKTKMYSNYTSDSLYSYRYLGFESKEEMYDKLNELKTFLEITSN